MVSSSLAPTPSNDSAALREIRRRHCGTPCITNPPPAAHRKHRNGSEVGFSFIVSPAVAVISNVALRSRQLAGNQVINSNFSMTRQDKE